MTIINQGKHISAEKDETVLTNVSLNKSTGVLTFNRKDFYGDTNPGNLTCKLNEIALRIIKLDNLAQLEALAASTVSADITQRESNIFLVPITESGEGAEEGLYREYVWVKNGNTGSFEAVGSTRIDLTPYLQKVKVINDYNNVPNSFDSSDPTVPSSNLIKTLKNDFDSHVHGNLTNNGKIGTAKNKPIITTTGGLLQTGSFEDTLINIKMNGTAGVGERNTFARGDHVHPTDITRASTDIATTSANGLMSSADKTKLDGLETYLNDILDELTIDLLSLQITATKSRITLNEATVLTITAKEGINAVTDLSIDLYKNGTLIQTLTTDNSGKATYTYTGTATGDITFEAQVGNIISETYLIHDYYIYDDTTHTITGTSNQDTTYSIGWDDIGVDLSNENFALEWNMQLTSVGTLFILGAKDEWSINPVKADYRTHLGTTSNNIGYGVRTTATNTSSSGTFATNILYSCKIEKQEHTFTYYINNTQIGTKTENWWSEYTDWSLYINQWSTGTTIISDIKLRKL